MKRMAPDWVWCVYGGVYVVGQGCSNPDKSAPTEPSLEFKNAVEDNDGTRAVTGNMCVFGDDGPRQTLRACCLVISSLCACRCFLVGSNTPVR
jgi:hypothetical protein